MKKSIILLGSTGSVGLQAADVARAQNYDVRALCANNNFINRLRELTTTRSIDYIRNLYTFADNHDKPSVLHGMALDMQFF